MTNAPAPFKTPSRASGTGLVIAAILAVVAAVVAWNASQLGTGGANARVGPAAFPYVVAAGLFVLAIGTALSALRGSTPVPEEKQDLEPIAWVVGGLVLQMILIAVGAGFSLASGLLFGLVARGFGRKPIWLTSLVGIVLAFAIWLAFAKLLQLSLPQGPVEQMVSALLRG
jgi:putative tricarboxylic transport membrane protein